MNIESHDHRERRCPILGHSVRFSYCLCPEPETPCRKILDCWWEEFDVAEHIRTTCGEETIEKILAPRKPKVLSLVEMIAQARRDRKDGDGQNNES